MQARSGQPLGAINIGTDNSRTGLNNDRPVQILDNVYATSPACTPAPCVQFLNKAAFATPGSALDPVGSYGNVGRNSIRGPHFVNFDLSLVRMFKLREHQTLQFRVEGFNIFNHTNFVGGYAPAGQYAGSAYQALSQNLGAVDFGRIKSAYDPRIFQFALRFMY